jgi:hypothetical protein
MSDVRHLTGDEEIRDLARRELAASRTPRHAAAKLGISRDALLGLAAGAAVRPATFALIRERLSHSP